MKYAWSYITKHVNNGRSDIVFQRSYEIQSEYFAHCEKLTNEYVTKGDYILTHYMNWRPFKNSSGKIFAVSDSHSKNVVLINNNFPYNLRKGISHEILFSTKLLSLAEIKFYIPDDKDFVWFVNYIENQSIPELWHTHIFSK
jgi:hypothetical protein